MTSSDPQPPEQPGGEPPRTQEIPVAQRAAGATAVHQLPPHPGATTPAPVQPVEAAVPTGPVDLVPGLGAPPPPQPVRPTPVPDDPPSPTAGPSPAPASRAGRTWPDTLESEDAGADGPRKRRVRAPRDLTLRDRGILLGIGLAVLSLVLLQFGLTMNSPESYWASIPLWSAFASVCALLGAGAFVASAAARDRLPSDALWRIAAAGLVGFAAFWLLVVLPVVATDRGFLLTAALAALAGSLWVGPLQKD